MKIKGGCTRHVILIGSFAIKIPRLNYGWNNFLNGLLGNMQEVAFGKIKDDRLCPVLFYIPGGFLLIMPRCMELSTNEFCAMDIKRFLPLDKDKSHLDSKEFNIPVENKIDSFGWYKFNGINNKIVALDYGS